MLRPVRDQRRVSHSLTRYTHLQQARRALVMGAAAVAVATPSASTSTSPPASSASHKVRSSPFLASAPTPHSAHAAADIPEIRTRGRPRSRPVAARARDPPRPPGRHGAVRPRALHGAAGRRALDRRRGPRGMCVPSQNSTPHSRVIAARLKSLKARATSWQCRGLASGAAEGLDHITQTAPKS